MVEGRNIDIDSIAASLKDDDVIDINAICNNNANKEKQKNHGSAILSEMVKKEMEILALSSMNNCISQKGAIEKKSFNDLNKNIWKISTSNNLKRKWLETRNKRHNNKKGVIL